MKLYLRGGANRFAMEQLQLNLFPDAPMEYTERPFSGCDGADCALSAGTRWLTASVRIVSGGRVSSAKRRMPAADADERARRQLLRKCYYQAALPLLPEAPAWGALSGVRPTKLTTKCLLDGGTEADCEALLTGASVSPERRRLCIECSRETVAAAARLSPGDCSVYVGIPFCPSRCAYCSFVSASIEHWAWLLPDYLTALEQEVRAAGNAVRRAGLRVRTVYMGGGTPTTLSAPQLKRLMGVIRESFDLSALLEYTVEGGRPDTLDINKLQTIRRMGADRMSINPQTMSDAVLAAVGRRHTSAQTVQAYADAVSAGYSAINMDLIAGLPGDTPASFSDSLRQVVALGPANVTVHTLALKKSADLFAARGGLPDGAAVAQMLRGAEAALRAAGYRPYYLYRQKYMSGSFENVGWTQPGYPGLYNIYMMEELHPIVSVGAGGMTKALFPDGRLRRQHNPKYPKEYCAGIEAVCRQKADFLRQLQEGG